MYSSTQIKKDWVINYVAISTLALHLIPLLTNKMIDQNDLSLPFSTQLFTYT